MSGTENLTSRFIQLRKENGTLFTGRKYSAQSGWQYILRQMKHEFPTIMAEVHYNVLKKKWSNLLQQYKDLKNPVHGDKYNADDVSWPFYSAIDEIIVSKTNGKSISLPDDNEGDIEEDINPDELLCVSVTPLDERNQISPSSSPIDEQSQSTQFTKSPLRCSNKKENLNAMSLKNCSRDPLLLDDQSSNLNYIVDNNSMTTKAKQFELPKVASSIIPKDITKLQRLEMNQSSRSTQQLQIICTAANHAKRPRQLLARDKKKVRKSLTAEFQKNHSDVTSIDNRVDVLESKLNDFFEYTKQRDEENRLILLRILQAVEKIADQNTE